MFLRKSILICEIVYVFVKPFDGKETTFIRLDNILELNTSENLKCDHRSNHISHFKGHQDFFLTLFNFFELSSFRKNTF